MGLLEKYKKISDKNFYVGDIVEFKQWGDMKKEYGLDKYGSIKCNCAFIEKMRHLCGTTARIHDINGNGIIWLIDHSSKGATSYTFTTDMIKKYNKGGDNK